MKNFSNVEKKIKKLEDKISKLESLIYSLLTQLNEEYDEDLIEYSLPSSDMPIFIENIFKDEINHE